MPGPTSGTGSLGGGLLVRKVTVGLAEAGDEALAGGKTEEDRNDAQVTAAIASLRAPR